MQIEQQPETLTEQYHFDLMNVGDAITVYSRFQHARVAASEFGRKHGVVFTCRMQPDRSMVIHRVAQDQSNIDKRGRQGKRRISQSVIDPTQQEFTKWLDTFEVDQSFAMPVTYRHLFLVMQAWTELHALRTGKGFKSGITFAGELLVTYTI